MGQVLPLLPQMSQLHKQYTPVRAVGMVLAAWRVAQISPGRVQAVLVSEGPFQDEDLLPARMGMSWVGSPWRIAYEAGGQAKRFVTYQKPAFDPRDRGWLPGQVVGL